MYAASGASTSPFGALGLGGGATGVPAGAPSFTHCAISPSSRPVSRRPLCPTNAGEARPRGQGGISRACVAASISGAHFRASLAVVSAKGAIPPTVWHPAHLPAKIGATSAYVTLGAPRTPPTVAVMTRKAPNGTSTARSRRIGLHTRRDRALAI